jgi:hypothetical protein
MSKSQDQSSSVPAIGLGLIVALSSAALLGGCIVAAPAPPPRRVYYAPPPPPPPPPAQPAPAYQEPVSDAEVQTNEAPPPLPDYEQPPCPQDGYLWTPGYWRWAGGGYYWVPGTWVEPPQVGVYWTPAYWGFVGGIYAFHAGYWGPHVGFYGGVNYGYGYGGVGFVGGRWAGNGFAYNRTVVNVNTTVIHNTYNETVINNVTVNKVSYNGGPAGIRATPTAQERVAASENHVPPTSLQRQHVQEAVRNPALAARANGGHPTIAATARPAAFSGPGVVGAHGAGQPNVGANRPAGQPNAGRPAGQLNNNAYRPAPGAAVHPPAGNGKPAAVKGPPAKQPDQKAAPKNREHEPDKGNR